MVQILKKSILLFILSACACAQIPNLPKGTTGCLLNSTAYVGTGLPYTACWGSADVFAQANTAAASLAGSLGRVVVVPGSYSVSATLACVNQISFVMAGVSATYTGTGTAIKCQNVEHSGILGNPTIIGPGTGGSTIGLQFGIGSGGNGNVTSFNTVSAQFQNFHTGCVFDGSPSNNGTYYNDFPLLACTASNIGATFIPTTSNYFNSNHFGNLILLSNLSDGAQISGSNGNSIDHLDTELNGGWGFNFTGGAATASWTIKHVWGEGNTSGDFNCGSQSNVTQLHILGGNLSSTPNFTSDPACLGSGNWLNVQSRMDFVPSSLTTFRFHYSALSGTGVGPIIENDDTSPSSGITGVLEYNRTGVNAGDLYLGTPEFPAFLRSTIQGYNNAATAGQGVTWIPCATSQKAETGSADASVLSCTPASAVGTYRACFTASVSSATSGVIGWTLNFTDSNGNAQSAIAQSLFQQGTADPALTFTTSAAGNYQSCSQFDVNNAGASIVVKWVGGGTTAAKVSATVERVI